MWHRGVSDLTNENIRALLPYDIVLRAFEDFIGAEDAGTESPLGLYDGLRLQALALLHTDLREVLMLQPGAFPIVDPTPLFDKVEFEQKGAFFWPGLWKTPVNSPLWLAIGADPHAAGWELQRGYVCVFLVLLV